MDFVRIDCEKKIAEALVSAFVAKEVVPETTGIPLWERFVFEVEYGPTLPDEMRVALVAQAIIESGRGTSKVSQTCLNFCGIKYRPELEGIATPQKVEVTSEVEGYAIFAKFPHIATFIDGWRKFLTRPYYAGWEQYKDNAEAFIRHIGKNWCPSPDYVAKVIACIPEARRLLQIAAPNPSPSSVKKIFLDPGHSAREPGARSNDRSVKEEEMNLLQADVIKRELEKTGHFLCTIYNPLVDDLEDVGLHAKGHDMSLHLHHNCYAGSADPGTEVLYDNDKSESQSREFATKISAAIAAALGTQDRGAKAFAGTVMDVAERQGTFPVVLTESYFLNPYDRDQAIARSTKAALAMCECIQQWFDK